MSKLNKKGFTLIELLAVIAILAILMLLVTPQILSLFNQGKRNTFAMQVQSIIKGAEENYLSNVFNPGDVQSHFCNLRKSDSNASASNLNPLNLTLDNNMSYEVEIDTSTGHVTSLTAYDGIYYFSKTSGEVKITDVTSDSSVSQDYNKVTNKVTITCTE